MKKVSLLSCLFVLTIFAFFSCTQNPPENSLTGTISGKAYYTNCNSTNGIVVSLASKNSIIAYAQCSDDGSYSFTDVPFDKYTVYAASSFSTEKILASTITLDDNTTVNLDDLQLTATGNLSGTVILDETATGNAGFTVYAAGTSYIAKTADDGSFTISGIPADADYEIYIEKGSFTSFWKKSNVEPFVDTSLEEISITTQEIKAGSLIKDGEKGDKGDKGDVGDKGDKGDKGDTGDKGDKGDVGDKGDKGDKGDTGDKGDKGDSAPAGTGADLRLYSIIYELDGGTLTDDSPLYHIYGLNTILGKPEKEGFSFVGWYTNPEFKGKPITKLNAKSVQSDIKLYALWTTGIAVSVTELSGKLLNCSSTASVLILDEAPDFDIIHTALTKNPQAQVELDFSLCEITSIPESIFENDKNLTAVTLPESVNKIGASAFKGCSALTTINIPEAVASIEAYTFNGCSSLQNLTLPENLTEIGAYAFEGCKSIKTLVIPKSTASIDKYAFSASGLTSLELPESLTSISEYLCYKCSDLETVIIPASIKKISTYAFSDCSSLNSINLPEKITSLGKYAFSSCQSLQYITLPSNLQYIFENAFYNSGLKEISIPDSVGTIDRMAFANCKSLTKVKMPLNLKNCGSGAFSGCENISEVIIPDLTKWVTITFSYNYMSHDSYACESLATNPLFYAKKLIMDGKEITNLEIPEGVTKINNFSFTNCENITSVTVPASLKTIEPSAFCGCSNVSSIYISDFKAWCECEGSPMADNGGNIYLNNELLTELTFTSDITRIGSYSFYRCLSLTKVEIPETLQEIGSYAFLNCKNLESVTLAEGVKTIDSYAFTANPKLTSFTVPASVVHIGTYAFYSCKQMSVITIRDRANWYATSNQSVYQNRVATSSDAFAVTNSNYQINDETAFTKHLIGTFDYSAYPNKVHLVNENLFKGL